MHHAGHAPIRKPGPSLIVPARAPILQRTCACGNRTTVQECSECGARSALLQRAAVSHKATSHHDDGCAPPLVDRVLRSGGAPLDSATRASMESRFGQDFGHVRIHTDEQASASARAVSALAYTVGRDVVFGQGQYAPGSSRGRCLIAHELTHVVQQGGVPWSGGALSIGAQDAAHELEADRAGEGYGATTIATPASAAGATLQRQPEDDRKPEMPQDAGGFVLRIGEGGRIEVLVRPPALPGVGPVGAGFRCEGGKCRPIASKDPFDLENRTYTPQEAIDLLGGKGPTGTNCPENRRVPSPVACCPNGTYWDSTRSACIPATPNVCLPAQMTPYGSCCAMGERWNYLQKRCEAAATGPTFPTLPPLTASPLTFKKPALRFGTIESATFDDFRTDDATVPAKHSAALDHLTSLLNVYQDVEVHVEGHTDSTASDTHNRKLSDRRAQAIRDALVARNATDPGRLKVKGFGEEQLRVAPERSDADRAANRRVEVWFHVRPTGSVGQGLRMNP